MILRRTGWPAALLTIVLVCAVLVDADVPLQDVAAFSVYVGLGLLLPGTLLWRLLSGDRERLFLEDLVLGLGLAYAVELAVYCACRAIGQPLLMWLWPLAVVLVCLLRTDRRELWRPTRTRPLPVGCSWALAGLLLLPVASLWQVSWARPMSEDALRYPYVDDPYHLSLITELKHDFPPFEPFVAGGRVMYHWFVHAHLAASSWATGVEPAMVQQRLGVLPMLAVIVLGTAVLVIRLGAAPWFGVLGAGLLTVFTGSDVPPVVEKILPPGLLVVSPTTGYALALMVPAVALVIGLLRDARRQTTGAWLAFIGVTAALTGAKGTALPILAGGLVLAVLLQVVVERRLPRRELAMLGVVAGCFVLGQLLVYGDRAELGVDPLATLERYATSYGAPAGGLATAGMLLVYFGYQSAAIALLGFARNARWRDPCAQFLVGSWLAGLAATLTFNDLSWNQAYFVRLTPVLLAVGAAWAVSGFGSGHWSRVELAMVAAGAGIGAVAAAALRSLAPEFESADTSVGGLVGGHALALGVAGVVTVLAVVLAQRVSSRRGFAFLVGTAAVLGLGLPSAVNALAATANGSPEWDVAAAGRPVIGEDGVSTARWLRAHSDKDDLLATNAHCRTRPRSALCDTRMFWLSAYAERQVLVEGWAYATRNIERGLAERLPVCCLPFWDPARLEANDAAFEDPTRATIDRLRTEYGVRWLVADTRARVDRAGLTRLVPVAYEAGEYVVFDLSDVLAGG